MNQKPSRNRQNPKNIEAYDNSSYEFLRISSCNRSHVKFSEHK